MAEDVEIKNAEMPEAGSLPPLRIEKGRVSYNGLVATAGQIEEECNLDLVWPQCMGTYKAMLKDSTISSTLNQTEMQIAKVTWKIRIPEGHEEELKAKARFLETIMEDMEHSWVDFIRRCSSFNRFGFAPIEKVYRKRTKSNGSRYSDGLYGVKELPLITQDSVAGWDWDVSGKHLTGLHQYKVIPTGKDSKVYRYSDDSQFIRREKFMLFRADPLKDSPIGTSPLNNVYMAWRYKSEYERQEAIGVSADVRGLKVIYLPPQYLSATASQEEKETYQAFQKALALMHSGEQSGLILPRVYDDNGNPLFEFEVKSVLGQATHSISEIIQRYRREIVSGLMAPHMILGQDGSGSFALAESLEAIAATVVEARLVEIRDVLNHDLIPQLFSVNGWSTETTPLFDFEEVKRTNISDWSSAIQRIASNGLIKLDANTINTIHEKLGLEIAYDDVDVSLEDIRENATNFTSNASEGQRSPTGQGTSTSASGSDASVANKEN
jgi:hypothetical protein